MFVWMNGLNDFCTHDVLMDVCKYAWMYICMHACMDICVDVLGSHWVKWYMHCILITHHSSTTLPEWHHLQHCIELSDAPFHQLQIPRSLFFSEHVGKVQGKIKIWLINQCNFLYVIWQLDIFVFGKCTKSHITIEIMLIIGSEYILVYQ